jgi:hypothetical protein
MAPQGHGDLGKVLKGGGVVLWWDYSWQQRSGGEGVRWHGKWSPKGAKGASIPYWPSAGRVPSLGGSCDTSFPLPLPLPEVTTGTAPPWSWPGHGERAQCAWVQLAFSSPRCLGKANSGVLVCARRDEPRFA